MGKIAIVVPVIETEPIENIRGFVDSVDAQTFSPRDIVVIYVVRYSESVPDFPVPQKPEVCISLFQRPKDEPRSQMEQCDVGIYEAFQWDDVDYCVIATAGDQLHEDFIGHLHRALCSSDAAEVAIPDLAFCDENMGTPETQRMSDRLNLESMVQSNKIPDCSMFTRDLYDRIPFSPEYGRSSFWIWWIKVFRALGQDAFANVHAPLYLYRFHQETASSFDNQWVDEGYRRFSEWARKEGLIPQYGSIKPFPKHVWHPKVMREKESP